MKLALMARDGADVIEANLRCHQVQGVDLFVIIDNVSTDGTLEILEHYEEAGLAKPEQMPGPLHRVMSKGRTKIARVTFELDADWMVHNDQDSFVALTVNHV